jgi:hypothetical protein
MSRKSVQGFCANGMQKTDPADSKQNRKIAACVRPIENSVIGYPLGMMTFFAIFSGTSC